MINLSIVALSLILLFSVLINIFFVWYLSRLTEMLMFFSGNLNDLLDILADFSGHIRSVYELETFYGDETLHNLLLHGEKVVQQVEKFEEIIYLTEDEEPIEDDVDEQELDAITREPSEETAEEEKNPPQVRTKF